MPHLEVDVKKKQVRVECEALNVEMPLEFFCCVTGTNEHESVLRSAVKPSHLHLALLMIGLKPGEPVHYSTSAKKWFPPSGPPVQISVEYERDGKTVHYPGYRLMRDVKTKKEAPPFTWVFAGSRIMEDNHYAADVTGYLVSVVNFDLAVLDVPKLASSANETLEWEYNKDLVPKTGTKVWMILEPAGAAAGAAAPAGKPVEKGQAPADSPAGEAVAKLTVDGMGRVQLDDAPVELAMLTERLKRMSERRPVKVRLSADDAADKQVVSRVKEAAAAAGVAVDDVAPPRGAAEAVKQAAVTGRMSDVEIDEAKVKDLRDRWEKVVAPHAAALREAAQAHYEVISALRREQQRLIDEADRIQRTIDQLEKEYQGMTTPRPEGAGS